MAEHINEVIKVAGALTFLLISAFAWWLIDLNKKTKTNQIDIVRVEKETAKAIADLRNNNSKEFKEVREDIADLKENNAIHFGELKLAIGKIETTVQMQNRHNREINND